jgi:SHS2 domain-containing protein
VAFEATAGDWPGLLATATAALGAVIRAPDDVPAEERRAVRVAGADREDVLVAWLGEALWHHERDGWLARGATLRSADALGAEGDLVGRRLDPVSEPPDRVVKAVTYHELHVEEGAEGRPWRVVVVLDL